MNAQNRFAALLTALGLAACTPTMPAATATEAELCRQWRDSLPSRSKSDTAQTQAEIGTSYDVQAAACPGFRKF